MTELDQVLNVIKGHKDELPGASEAEKEEYLQNLSHKIRGLFLRTDEDRRVATQMAVDASKTFVQIAIAVFVAIGGFFQFGFKNNWSNLPVLCLGIAAGLTFMSICFGFLVISDAYKRGDGRKGTIQPAWSTEALRGWINWQALTGVVALVVFALAIILQNPATSPSPQPMRITLLRGVAKTISSLGPVKVTGQWSQLSIERRGDFTLQVEPVPDKETRSFILEVK